MADRCGIRQVSEAAEWEALFSRVDHPHLVQSWAYGEAKQASGGWLARRRVFEIEGEPVAICQILDKSLAGIRWASRLNRGPLFLNVDAGEDVIRDVYGALRRGWRHLHGVLLLAPALNADPDNYRMMTEIGFRDRHVAGWRSACLDLRLDEDQLRKNLTHNWRNRLAGAERAGLELRISNSSQDVEWIVDRHVENMREQDFVGPKPALVRALFRAAPDNSTVVQARLGDQPVGGLVAYRFGDTAEAYIGWFGREGRKANVGNLLYWRAILEMRTQGCRCFDLGGYSRDDKYGHFKRNMNGMEYELLNEWLAF